MNRGDIIRDFNRHHAIVVGAGRVLVHVVELECGELVVRALRPEDILDRGFVAISDYPLRRAVRVFLKHSGGVSVKAREVLRALTHGEGALC